MHTPGPVRLDQREAKSEILSEEHAENLLRDVRSAVWRAGFAAHLAEPST